MSRIPRSTLNRLHCLPCRGRLMALLAAAILSAALSGCATWQAPEALEDSAIRARAVSETEQDVRLSATVLSAEESRRIFGNNVNAAGIQPVWVEVENRTADTLWLLRTGADPDYFSPLEVAWSYHPAFSKAKNTAIDEHFDALDFQNPIPPGATVTGIIFTKPHHRTRVLNVDLLGPAKVIPFTLFLAIPDELSDDDVLYTVKRYADAQREEFEDLDALRNALQGSPCCATGTNGTTSGDPINVVLVGNIDDIAAALVRRGFRVDRRDFDDTQQLFGRQPDFVMRKVGQDVPAYWIRGWVAPLRYLGQLVFLVQVGRPVGGRFAVADAERLELHPYVDEARNLLIQDLIYSGGLTRLGFTDGSGIDSARSQDNTGQSFYYTDGLRAVMFFVTRPVALSEVQLLKWVPYLERAERKAAAGRTNATP